MNRKLLIILLFVLGNSLLLFSQNYQIGDVIVNPDGSKGVVFWVNETYTEGWMVAMEDVPDDYQWGAKQLINNMNYQSTMENHLFNSLLIELDGKENTRKIREKAQSANWQLDYAAGIVDYENGWYLPSIGQLRILIANMALLEVKQASNNEFVPLSTSDKYWSSTQNGANSAWTVWGSDGSVTSNQKTNTNAVREIRDFTIQNYTWSANGQVIPGETTSSITVSPEVNTLYAVEVSLGGGCIGVDNVMIEVDHGTHNSIEETACESYTWSSGDGLTYTESGTYTYPYENEEGCPSVDTLHLTIY